MNIQYKKGVLELCVLSMLCKSDQYGYDISEYLSKKIDISDGTIYPILRKLKTEGLVTTYLSEQSGGPPRKYYRLTVLGKEEFFSAKAEWISFTKIIKEIIEEETNE